MEDFKIEDFRQIHFVGVGGISMYLLAIYCKDCGVQVSGSDIKASKYTDICKGKGIKIYIGHKRRNISAADLVVYSGAINEANVELVEARKREIKVIDRAELLAHICKKYKYVIGVAGTHGKTTTCAMIYHILRESGKSVSCHIGADIENARLNPSDEYLVLECCEYNRSFLRLNYNIAVILNIDNDHLDCYQNMYNLRNAFRTFLKRADTRFVFDNSTTKCIKNKSIRIKQAKVIDINKFMCNNKKFVLENCYGEHNINNATVAVAVCSGLGLSYTKIYKALKTFKPAGRRCEMLGKIAQCDIIADYAHHPSEIECLYKSLKCKYNKVYMVFQPHTYSRTKLLLYEFVGLLSRLEDIFIYKEYSARESKNRGYSAKQLCKYLDNAKYLNKYKELKKEFSIIKNDGINSCIVFVGAGDIYSVAKRLVAELGVVI